MATIDLIVLGMIQQKPLSAYDIQKLVEYRNISQWVKISTASIYKKVLQLENKGLIESARVRLSRFEKNIYKMTDAGRAEFERLMLEVSGEPVRLFLDFNTVILNLDGLPPEQRRVCVNRIEKSVQQLKASLGEDLARKQKMSDVPEAVVAVLKQQYTLAQTIEAWVASVRESME